LRRKTVWPISDNLIPALDQINYSHSLSLSLSLCISGSTTYRNGTCLTNDECDDKRGRASGNCAAG
jgi:hypothetical protein